MLTRHRDLRTGLSVWEGGQLPHVPHAPLTRDITADVLVIGAGISGAMTAEALSEAGLGVAVVDRRGPIKGSTAASTALLQYEIDTPLVELTGKIGERDAIRAWRRSRLALDGLAAKLQELGVATAVRRDSLYLAGNTLDADGLRAEIQARRHAGLESVYLSREDLARRFEITRDAAIMSFGNLAGDPCEMTAAFLRRALELGAAIHAPVEIGAVQPDGRRLVASTTAGQRISARWVVFATGYELPAGIDTRAHRIISTWAMATAQQRNGLWPQECLIWEASDPYLYLRTTTDGRVICGGEDAEFSDESQRDALLPAKTRMLERKLGELFPHLDVTAQFAWTGSFGSSPTGLPTIGPMKGMPNAFVVLGFGGNGITYSRIAAEILRSTLSGKADPDGDLYEVA